MQYIDRLRTLPPDDADNALIIGQALHTGIERGVQAAIDEYYMSYPIITDKHINEAMKLEYLIPKAKDLLDPGGTFEFAIKDHDFIGYLDYVIPNNDGTVDICDFKYSNNIDNYINSPQLHLYKYFYEKYNGKKVRSLYYMFVPKINIKQKETENLYEFRQRIQQELEASNITLSFVEYDESKVIDWLLSIKRIQETTEFEKNPSYLCRFCEYEGYCQKGNDYMLLPTSERRTISTVKRKKIWIYGAAFSGKTTMLDKAPNPLNINTDGNIEFVLMPYIAIKDEVKVDGRRTVRTFAWEIFKNVITELEKKQNDFKTIIVDLLEDTREMCRLYMYDKLGIQHESDQGYGKGWDIIKTEYLSTMRRFFNLDYENVIAVSHEDISKDITKKNGQNITRIAPNIQEAIANKIAGMVDIVARVVVEDDDTRTLNFKSNEVIFGGGRLKGISKTTIPLDWGALMDLYDEVNAAQKGKNSTVSVPTENTTDISEDKPTRGRKSRAGKVENDIAEEVKTPSEAEVEAVADNTVVNEAELAEQVDNETVSAEAPTTGNDTVNPINSETVEDTAEIKPVRRTRKRRGE